MAQQLSSTDSQMLFLETPGAPNHITPFAIYDQSTAPGGVVRFRDIVRRLEESLDLAPNFRRKLLQIPFKLDEPYWVDDSQFDIDFHVRHLALPKPGDWRQLCIQIARLLSRPLDPSRPLWEMYVIEGVDHVEELPEGCFATLFKIHHSLVDGMGTLALLNSLWETEPTPRAPQGRNQAWQPAPPPSTVEILMRGYLNAWLRPGQMLARAATMLPSPLKIPFAPKPKETPAPPRVPPKTPLNGLLTSGRVFDAKFVDLSTVKAIRKLVPGATVNDVTLAVVGGALRRYLLAKDALPETTLTSTVPVSIRSEAARDDAAGNHIQIRVVALGTDTADAVARLTAITAATADMKAQGAQGALTLMDIGTEMPGAVSGFMARAMSSIGDRTGRALLANTVVTNVPGMQIPLYLCGAKALRMGGGAPCAGNMGVMHAISSYNGQLGFNIVGARDLLPDPDLYMRCLDEAFAEYAGLAAGNA